MNMNATMTPVNKKSALFLSRKTRVETVSEALERFAVDITGPETASKVREMLFNSANGQNCEVALTIKIRSDAKNPGYACASIDSKLSSKMGKEYFYGLK